MGERIEKFEDILAWQKARMLTKAVYETTASGSFSHDFGLRDQIRRSAVSIMSNIAEGFERGRPSEFHQFLSIAKASCAELRSQLYVALDAGHLTVSAFNDLMQLATEVGRLPGGLRAAIQRKKDGS